MPSEPLDPKRIKSLEKLRVIDRTDINWINMVWQDDPTKPRYGQPEQYCVKFQAPNDTAEHELMVHHSRIIELHGDTLPRHATIGVTAEQRYWGISALQRANERLRSLGASLGSIDQLLSEFGVGKFKIKDLPMMMASEDGAQMIQRRAELMDLTRSAFRSQFIDADEDFTRDTISFAGLPEVLRMLFLLISADTGYPMTRLFGMSPAGENATGESDMNNYYDMVRSSQVAELQPILLRLVRIISQWKGIDEPYIEFRPLETMNEKEKAELDKQIADTAQVEASTYKTYIDAGVLDASEVRNMKWGNTLGDMPVEHELPKIGEEE